MEGFKKGVDNAMPFILLISVLLMDILLITGLMKLYFGWDSTMLAGVIAFIGAIIGGSITLMGVNSTIREGRREGELESSLMKLKFTNTLSNNLSMLQKEIPFEEPDYVTNIKIFSKLHESISEILTSTEALVLGEKVTDEIVLLGNSIVKARIDSMVMKGPDYEDVTIDLSEKFFACYKVIGVIRQEETRRYHRL